MNISVTGFVSSVIVETVQPSYPFLDFMELGRVEIMQFFTLIAHTTGQPLQLITTETNQPWRATDQILWVDVAITKNVNIVILSKQGLFFTPRVVGFVGGERFYLSVRFNSWYQTSCEILCSVSILFGFGNFVRWRTFIFVDWFYRIRIILNQSIDKGAFYYRLSITQKGRLTKNPSEWLPEKRWANFGEKHHGEKNIASFGIH